MSMADALRVIGMEPSAQGILPAADMPADMRTIEAASAQAHTRLAMTLIDSASDDDPASGSTRSRSSSRFGRSSRC